MMAQSLLVATPPLFTVLPFPSTGTGREGTARRPGRTRAAATPRGLRGGHLRRTFPRRDAALIALPVGAGRAAAAHAPQCQV